MNTEMSDTSNKQDINVGAEDSEVFINIPSQCDTNDTSATLQSCGIHGSQPEAIHNCAESSVQLSIQMPESDDSADSMENLEFLSASSGSHTGSEPTFIDIYADISLDSNPDELGSNPKSESPDVAPPSGALTPPVSEKSEESSREVSQREAFFVTANAQRLALKSFSDISIRTFPTQNSMTDICRICHCESDSELGPLIAPCFCRGSLRYVHQDCLQQWIKSSNSKECELCGYHFTMESKVKPLYQWNNLSMSTVERRKLLCTVLFHIIAITCVTWSLYVLIEKTTVEIKDGDLQWPFWTKLIVVAIGFTGGLVFMYIQCKVYVQLWKRLRAFNRIIFIKNHSPATTSPSTPDDPESGGVASIPEDIAASGGPSPGHVPK